jgi:ATP-dependent helicase/nuclease subunit A
MSLTIQQQKISQKATKLQMQASNPESSVWVSASAGTGKTHVLTQRILRLLLNDPFLRISEILAITFTKAAAMEMQNRLISELSKWVKLDENKLYEQLEFLLQRKPTLKDITNARTLLTKVIDDPVGLNISTIHSFCETLLRKFPLEAGIPSAFTLIEERQERKLLRKAWFKAVKQQFDTNKDLFGEVLELMGEHSLTEAVSSILNQKNRFYEMLYHHGGVEQFLESLKAEFDLSVFDEDKLMASIIDFDMTTKDRLKEIMTACSYDKTKKAQSVYDSLNLILQNELSTNQLVNAYLDIYLTKKLEPSKSVFTKKTKESVSFDLEEFTYEEAERIISILDSVTNLQNFKISKVLCILADKMFEFYKQEKLEMSYLDFNDLVDYAEKLINKVEIQDWIRYKLDSKVKHCLIDEAQDTDMQQWNILHGLIAEFYYGDGQHERVRTTFAVGDMKQSIYRFRGANPEVFAKIRDELDEKSKPVNHQFNVVGLHTSFRSTQAVLNFVDEVFSTPERKVALDGIDESLHHQVFKFDEAGRVELAKLVTKDDLEPEEEQSGYEIPVNAQETTDALTLRQLNYKNVATKIVDLFNSPEGFNPQDIIILLRNRTGMPDLIEQLTKANIPHTGSDEIYLSNSVIIDDLMAFAKFLAFEDDNLSLLQVLKSPAFNYADEELFAYYEQYKESGKANFYRYIKDLVEFDEVISKLNNYRSKVNKVRVFDLYKQILNSTDLTEKMMASFGGSIPAQQSQVKDTIDEFLRQIEGFNQLSILAFLDWFKKDALKVKKNTANAKGAVRIMTVHGSKGLEAKAIFLPDSGLDSVKSSISKEKLLFKKSDNGKDDTAFIYKTRSTVKPTVLETEILAEEEKLFFEDDMRLLYVALTRARAHIYVSAIQENNELSDYSWYSILAKVMDEKIEENAVGYTLEDNGVRVFKTAQLIESGKNQEVSVEIEPEDINLPDWVNQMAEKETSMLQERASYNLSSLEYIEKLKANDIESYQYGNVVHKLLEELPKLDNSLHSDYIDSFLANKKDIVNKDGLKAQIIKVLDKYADLFNPENSFAEVNIQGMSKNKKITGIVDRIAVLNDKVYVIDYKTGQKDEVYKAKYKQQLDLYTKVLSNVYKDKQVVGAILWFSNADLELV